MLRKMVFSMVVMVVAIGFAFADEFTATITKVDGDNVTYQKFKKAKKGEKAEPDGEAVTISAKGAKVVYGTVTKGKAEAGDAIEGGLTNKIFAGKKGVSARITTSDDNKSITQILITKAKKKAK